MSKEKLKRADIRPCAICGKGLLHTDIAAYHVGISQYIADLRAIQQTHGLELMMGGGIQGATLAHFMGPDPTLLKRSTLVEGYLCQTCFMDVHRGVAEVWERLMQAQDNQSEPAHV